MAPFRNSCSLHRYVHMVQQSLHLVCFLHEIWLNSLHILLLFLNHKFNTFWNWSLELMRNFTEHFLTYYISNNHGINFSGINMVVESIRDNISQIAIEGNRNLVRIHYTSLFHSLFFKDHILLLTFGNGRWAACSRSEVFHDTITLLDYINFFMKNNK